MKPLITWLKQPTSVAGISALSGTVSAILLHQLTWFQAVPLLGGAVVSIILPDNTAAKDDAIALTRALASKFNAN
jgi:hypothetical protein